MRVMRSTALALLLLLAAAALLGCGSNNDVVGTPGPGGGPDLAWDLQGLEPLGAGFVYEAWLIVGGQPVSVGRFDVMGDGTPTLTGAALTAEQVAGAQAFVLTIEPAVGDDPAPAATKILGGDFLGPLAVLSIGHPAALGDDFSAAAGSFILETPTTAGVPGDYDQGIWWLDPAGGPGASLSLPALPAGWAYEGWVVPGGTPISTGRFLTPAGMDSDGPGANAGPDGAPPFPGQDFITPATSLLGAAAVISIEPEPDDSPAPFVLKPLVDVTIEDVGAGALQSMGNEAAASPTGTATLL